MLFTTTQLIQSIIVSISLIKQPPTTAIPKNKKATKFSTNLELYFCKSGLLQDFKKFQPEL